MQYIQLQSQDAATIPSASSGAFNLFIDQNTNTIAVKNSAGQSSVITSASYALTASYALSVSGGGGGSGAGFPYEGDAVITGSLSLGLRNTTVGPYSNAQGSSSWAIGTASHAEGAQTFAYGAYSHTEGSATFTSTIFSNIVSVDVGNNIIEVTSGSFFQQGQDIAYVYYAGGNANRVWKGVVAGVNGNYVTASGAALETIDNSAFWGFNQNGSTLFNLSSGSGNIGNLWGPLAGSVFSHGEGSFNLAGAINSHAEGRKNAAVGNHSHAEGVVNLAKGLGSHAEGNYTVASGQYSHTEGNSTDALGYASHAEGYSTNAIGNSSHAEGNQTVASGSYSHSEGEQTLAMGESSHTEGYSTIANGRSSHAEGESTTANADYSHAEGSGTVVDGAYGHAEGSSTRVTGNGGHAEGTNTLAAGAAHSEGYFTTASGIASHAEGKYTVALGQFQHVQGQFNLTSTEDSAFIIGNGTDENNRSNLVFASGSQVQITGSLVVTGSATIYNMLVIVSQSVLPNAAPSGAIMTSGSGADLKPYFWNGDSWTALF